MSPPAAQAPPRRPGAGIAIDCIRLVRMRTRIPLSRAQLALKMSGGPCAHCGSPYRHKPDCPDAGNFTITPDAIAKIENGYRHPKPVTLGRLCEALGCQPEDLLPEMASGKPRPCPECRALYGHDAGCSHAT